MWCRNPNNNEVYQNKLVTTRELFDTINECTTIFEHKTLMSFVRWCSTRKTLFLRTKDSGNTPNRNREPNVMNDIHHGNITLLSLNIGRYVFFAECIMTSIC